MIPSHGYEVPPVDFSLECSYFRSSVFLCLQHGAICWTGIPAMIKDIRTRYESIYCGALFVDKQLHQFKQKETSPHYNSPTTPISQTSTARVQEQNPYMQHTYINPPPFHPPLSPPPSSQSLPNLHQPRPFRRQHAILHRIQIPSVNRRYGLARQQTQYHPRANIVSLEPTS